MLKAVGLTIALLLFNQLALPLLATSVESLDSVIQGQNLLTHENTQVTAGKKGMVAIFMSAQCPCSHSHVTMIKKLAADFSDFSFVAIHSNADESLAQSREYFTQLNLPFPVIQDVNFGLADRYRAFKTPHAYVLGSQGEILYQGGVSSSSNAEHADRQYLRYALTDVAAGRAVKVTQARTLGCIISRNK